MTKIIVEVEVELPNDMTAEVITQMMPHYLEYHFKTDLNFEVGAVNWRLVCTDNVCAECHQVVLPEGRVVCDECLNKEDLAYTIVPPHYHCTAPIGAKCPGTCLPDCEHVVINADG